MTSALSDFQNRIGMWEDITFPGSTPQTLAYHLEKEVKELIFAIAANKNIPEETADCFILLLGIAHKLEFDLLVEAGIKFVELKKRKWLPPGKNGIIEHDRQYD